MLAVRNVSKSYTRPDGEVHALRDVSLEVGPGELVVVRGPSGSGKTTLLLACGGLLRPDGGQITVCGESPYALGPDARAALRSRTVGFVFQQFHLVPYLNVLENVLAPALGGRAAGAVARASDLLERFGLTGRRDHLPGELSTGERQRTALARAMVNRPKLLLADEPTGNLDEDNGRAVLDAMTEFADQGGAVLLVTHEPAVAETATRALWLDAGHLRGT